MKAAGIANAPSLWRTLEVIGGQLHICSDGGCQPAVGADLEEVVAMLPSLLAEQERDRRRRHWHELARAQMGASK